MTKLMNQIKYFLQQLIWIVLKEKDYYNRKINMINSKEKSHTYQIINKIKEIKVKISLELKMMALIFF